MDPNFNSDPGASAAVSALWGGIRANPDLLNAIAGAGGAVLSASALYAAPTATGMGLIDFGIAQIPDFAFLKDMSVLAAPEADDDGFSLDF
ncbi:hypothetical protein [Paracoccus sp. ME4]|uniref:hypothetical protein n=1 Tax=Paracoccus sp. ME4 TaxID=3138066 RepID=UPI00398B73D2